MLEMPRQSEDALIKSAALALLARREHSKQELLTKLSRKFTDETKILQQIDDLAANGLQSEERFVEAFVHFKMGAGKGPKLIKQELKRRGVSDYLIASYVVENDDQWLSAANDAYRKKFGTSPVVDVREKARRIRFMVSRGFTPDLVFRLLEGQELYT